MIAAGARLRVTRLTGRQVDRVPFEGVAYLLAGEAGGELLCVNDPEGLPIVIARAGTPRAGVALELLA